MQSRRTTIISIILAVVIIAGFVALLLYSHRQDKNSGTVTLYSAPDAMTMTMDGKKVNPNGTYKVSPGTHKVHASFDHFVPKDDSFTIKAGQKLTFKLYLTPSDDIGRQYLSDNPQQAYKISGISGPQTQQKYDNAQKKITFLDQLPWIDQYYRIDYGASQAHPNDTTAVAIYITYYSDDGKNLALDWIRHQGYDPATLEIIWQKGSDTFQQ